MHGRLVKTGGVALAVAVLGGLLAGVGSAGPGASAGQAASSDKAAPAPRTAWGAPDLQGIWTDEYAVPFQRPARFGTREVLTDEEIAELDKARAEFPTFSVRSQPVGSEQDVAGDPPNGRIPPLTADAEKLNGQADAFRTALLQAATVCKGGAAEVPNCAGVKYTGVTSPRRRLAPPDYLYTAVNRSDGPEDRGLGERCLAAGLPSFNSFQRIVQSADAVSIFYDIGQGQGRSRVIPITDAPHIPSTVRQWWGDSRGRWEHDTLVVDVTNFNEKRNFQSSRQNLHLVERWTRVDANTLEYVVTLDDPTTWTTPWTFKVDLQKQSDQENRIYYEPRCHEGNFAMPTMLLGARMDDERFAKGTAPDPATKCYIVCLPAVSTPNPFQ